jgi:hypothetical protein
MSFRRTLNAALRVVPWFHSIFREAAIDYRISLTLMYLLELYHSLLCSGLDVERMSTCPRALDSAESRSYGAHPTFTYKSKYSGDCSFLHFNGPAEEN